MGFAQPISIKEVITEIDGRKLLLPSIQREFVWYPDQIGKLFDSLMKGYPIGSFLFWEVGSSNINKYQFYEFIRNYHERDFSHNQKADVCGNDNITAVLDGQQRLTALYLGLKGSYSYKEYRRRWDNDDAFPERRLYLNLLSYSEDSENDFDFEFLTEDESHQEDQNHFWFRVGDILEFDEPYKVTQFLLDRVIYNFPQPNSKFANKTLSGLQKIVFDAKPINFFLESDSSLDKVLNIFIRINSGGTKLSYSDLLLSIATAQWSTRDAREAIIKAVDDINRIGDGFSIDKDFILKSCLILCDFGNIAFRVDNFSHDNMLKIEQNWQEVIDALSGTFHLVANFGFDSKSLASNNALIPIAYYLMKIGNPTGFVTSAAYQEDRKKIQKFLTIVLLKRLFSGQPDNILRALREVIRENPSEGFPYEKMVEKQKGLDKNFTFTDDEIENLFSYQYGQAYTFSVLSILYPGLDYRNKFHIDHIFPKSKFTWNKLSHENLSENQKEFFANNFNCLANLQLLEGIPNEEKSARDYKEWLDEKYPEGSSGRVSYCRVNFIPEEEDLSFNNFDKFVEERKALMIKAFREMIK